MLVILSHLIAFTVLFAAAVSDLKTTEVPDSLNILGVVAGLALHFLTSLSYMDYGVLFSDLLLSAPFEWFMALGEPLAWSFAVGAVFSLYGWGLYFLGMWGGADAFAMSVLGFGAPYAVSGPELVYPASVFTAVLVSGFLYTLGFGLYKLSLNPEVIGRTVEDMESNQRRVAFEIVAAGALSTLTAYNNLSTGVIYFCCMLFLIALFHLFQNIQEDLMVEKVAVDDLEGGEVLGPDEELGGKIEGITQEDIDSIDKDYVNVREGIRFVPVFPVALLLVDVLGFRITWLFILFSL